MILPDNPINEATYDALYQMASYTRVNSDRMVQVEDVIQHQIVGVIIESLESRHVDNLSRVVSQIYLKVINLDLGPAFHLVRTCVSNGTLTTEILWIQAALLAEEVEHIINEHAG